MEVQENDSVPGCDSGMAVARATCIRRALPLREREERRIQ